MSESGHFRLPQSSIRSMRRFPFYISFLFLLFTTSFSTSSAQVFPGCNHTFACGGVRGISYPFTGGDRPSYCGPPEFQLRCVDDWPELTMGSLSYRVRRLDDIRQSLVIARLDLWNNSCTDKFFNSTPDSDLFSFDFGNEGLTLFYGCSAIDYTPEIISSANISGTPTDSYHLIGAVPTDPILSVTECQVRVRVPILQSSAQRLADNRSLFLEALMDGFNVNYSVPFGDQCSECLQSGGQCGFDSESSQPMCICGDLPCPIAVAEKKNQLPLKIGMGAGGAAILCLFLGCVLYVAKRRKEHKMQGKHVSLPHFSNGVSNPNTNLSQRIPSFPYSKTDLENGSTNYGVQVFNYMELEEATKNFDPSQELGEGGFGTVYYGKLSDGREVAVKRLYENNLRRAEQFKNELEILTRLHHPNLVKLYGSTSRRSQELLLVYEYIPNGTVADHLHGKQAYSKMLNWHLRLRIALETANALAYLHHSDIIHRDVKTNNILLDDNFQVKVADFGLSRLFPNNATHVSTAPQGTPGYVDPEYYQVYQLTDKSDVFSFGVVLIELISSLEAVDMSRHRRDINLSNMALNKIQRGALHELVDPNLGFETDLCVRRMMISVSELAFRCLQQDKEMRPPMDEVLEILRGIENKESGTRQAEVVDISGEDVRLMKNVPPPLSPDSLTTDKLVSTTTTDGSF